MENFEPVLLEAWEYYMGWIIQPLNLSATSYYIYENVDTSRSRGFTFGSKEDCYSFINTLIRHGG